MGARRAAAWIGTVLVAVVVPSVVGPAIAGAGGGGGGEGAHCPGFAEGAAVEMYDNCFAGTTQFVEPDTTVTVENSGSLPHSLTAVDGTFDTGTLDAGETATVEVADAGVVRVYCTLHGSRDGGGMTGTFVVGDGGAAARKTVAVDAEPVSTRTAGAAAPVVETDDLPVLASMAVIAAVFCGGLGAAALVLQVRGGGATGRDRSTLSAEPGSEPLDVLVGHRVRGLDLVGRAVGVVQHDREPDGRARARRGPTMSTASSTRTWS